MPDLSHQAVHQFWHDYQDPSIYRVITFMEGVEDWTLDESPELDSYLQGFGEMLDNIGSVELSAEKELIELCSCVKTGRCLRILMALDMAYPGAAANVIMHAEDNTQNDNDMCGIFLRRNIVFERLRLLSRVFSEDRIQLVVKALEDSSYD